MFSSTLNKVIIGVAITTIIITIFGFLYYQYKSAIEQNATLTQQKTQLEEIIRTKNQILELTDKQRQLAEQNLADNRKEKEQLNSKSDKIQQDLDKRTDGSNPTSDYLKALVEGMK